MSDREDTARTILEASTLSSALLSTPGSPATANASTLSKNARKRQLKAERFAASKAERRARDKERRREKKREQAEKRRVGDVDALDEDQQRCTKRRKAEGRRTPFHARVVIDLAFDDKMSEKEVVSLCSQLAYTYSSNRKARTPFKALLCTSLNGKTLARLEALGGQHKRWHGVEFWEEGYEDLWVTPQRTGGDTTIPVTKESAIYLTGDAEDELEELHEGKTYIIGGICDKNRYKNLCLNKAKGQCIRSARLPIGTYLANLATRKILTVNQVFDILLNWVEDRDWSKALYAVMPKRKFQNNGGSMKATENDAGDTAEKAGSSADEDGDVDVDVGTSIDIGMSADAGADKSEVSKENGT